MYNFVSFLEKYGLKESHVYLLELIPLIEMIWADGANQEAELSLLYRYTIEHLSELTKANDNVEVISEKDVNEFLDKFTRQQPDPILLKELRYICFEKLGKKVDDAEKEKCKDTIRSYCLDIAAACVAHYPYKFNERILDAEKKLLTEIFEELSKI